MHPRHLSAGSLALATFAVLAGCGNDGPTSPAGEMSAIGATPPTDAARVVSAAPVAATAEQPYGLVAATPRTFTVTIENVGDFEWRDAGVFNTPVGASGPGALLPGGAYEFSFVAGPGARLSFATMYVQSNDLFFAPDAEGLTLFEGDEPVTGSITDRVSLWDAGTEVNQTPGSGPDQAPRQAGANTGTPEDGPVQVVDDGFSYPDVTDVIDVVVSAAPEAGATRFTVRIVNLADSPTPLAPGVFVVHTAGRPLFTAGAADAGDGLEALAEDGNPGPLAAALAAHAGVPVILAPGAWAVHIHGGALFVAGAADAGDGLEALAEDGSPGPLAAAVASRGGVAATGTFTTPVGAGGPGPLLPGHSYRFTVTARPGQRLSFATMFVQSNDLFLAPASQGLPLFRGFAPRHGDVTDEVFLWDAGTEVNQAPGWGPDQAPRQAGPDTGADEGGVVRPVDDGFVYPSVSRAIRVSLEVQ